MKICRITGMTLFIIFSSWLAGCATKPQVKRLNEKQIAKQEAIADKARYEFYCGKPDKAYDLLKPLCKERTTSQPLYECELGSCYLADNNKELAKKYLLRAYKSIEVFFDPALEKKAVSLWGAESDKVFKGEPYEQATLGLFTGLILLEDGDTDNALACFKNGQIADSDVQEDLYKSDYGLLQLLEAKCYLMRNEPENYEMLLDKAIESFASTYPGLDKMRAEYTRYAAVAAKNKAESDAAEAELLKLKTKMAQAEQEIIKRYANYYAPVKRPYNTLLLVWSGRAPQFHRAGKYGEKRFLVKAPRNEVHFELLVDDTYWYDVLHGFADITFQATTRGGREMDNVLASQAAFKSTAHAMGESFFDSARNTSDARAALVLMALGAISHGVGAAANPRADIRCWRILPDEIMIVPLNLAPGRHQMKIDCYNAALAKTRSINYNIEVKARPFQFINLVIPSMVPAPVEKPVVPLPSEKKKLSSYTPEVRVFPQGES